MCDHPREEREKEREREGQRERERERCVADQRREKETLKLHR
jgi:hypothetical protein